MLVSITGSAYAANISSERICINGITYIVVIDEDVNDNIVSIYDCNNVLIEKYAYIKNERIVVDVLSEITVSEGSFTASQTPARTITNEDDGYIYYGTYTFPLGEFSTIAGLTAMLIALGIPIAVSAEIATLASQAGYVSTALGGVSVILEIVIDEYGKVDSEYQYSKRVSNTYEKITENDNHIAGPLEWIRKTSIDS